MWVNTLTSRMSKLGVSLSSHGDIDAQTAPNFAHLNIFLNPINSREVCILAQISGKNVSYFVHSDVNIWRHGGLPVRRIAGPFLHLMNHNSWQWGHLYSSVRIQLCTCAKNYTLRV